MGLCREDRVESVFEEDVCCTGGDVWGKTENYGGCDKELEMFFLAGIGCECFGGGGGESLEYFVLEAVFVHIAVLQCEANMIRQGIHFHIRYEPFRLALADLRKKGDV